MSAEPPASLRIGFSYRGPDDDYTAYTRAVEAAAARAGVTVECRWLASAGDEAVAEIDDLHAICFTGGSDVDPHLYGETDPERLCEVDERRDAAEVPLARAALAGPRPVLAICRGAQLVNVVAGGTLRLDLGEANGRHRGDPDPSHDVMIGYGTILYKIAQQKHCLVNSSHHQAVAGLAHPFLLNASAPDGTAEGFEWKAPAAHPWLLAVQWHPERWAEDEFSVRIFDELIRQALTYAGR